MTEQEFDLIREISAEFVQEGICNSAGGPSCGPLCEELSLLLDCDMTYGSIYDADENLIDDDHAWLLMDATIVDPTIDQFQIVDYPGVTGIAVITSDHPMYQCYDCS